MKIIKFLAAGVISLAAVTGNANAATQIVANNEDINFIFSSSIQVAGYTLHMFDNTSPEYGGSNLQIDLPFDFVTVTPSGGDFTAASTALGGSLTLTATKGFFLALCQVGEDCVSNNDLWIGDSGVDYTSAGNFATVSFSVGAEVSTIAVDVQPVPLPATAWLFGAALLGFAGVSRRTKA